jgi:predicted nucleotidyltransferase
MRDNDTQDIAVIQRKIEAVLARHPSVALAVLFGSTATGAIRPESDLDLAVSAVTLLDTQSRIDLLGDLALAFGRPVDLVDLDRIHGPLLHQILTKGRLVLCKDRTRYAKLLLKMLYEQADFMPYYRRILASRRKAWIGT